MSGLMILGAGGHGRVVAEAASLMKRWDEIVFLDDNKALVEVNGHRVIGELETYKRYKDRYQDAFVAIGYNKLRREWMNRLLRDHFRLPVIIHPFSFVSCQAQIGRGTVVMAGAILHANAIVGEGCIINTSSSIDHDCVVEDGVHVSPGVHIGGTVHIGENSWICIGASVAHNINIGKHTIVAAGATVVQDMGGCILVGGVPAKKIKDLIE